MDELELYVFNYSYLTNNNIRRSDHVHALKYI